MQAGGSIHTGSSLFFYEYLYQAALLTKAGIKIVLPLQQGYSKLP